MEPPRDFVLVEQGQITSIPSKKTGEIMEKEILPTRKLQVSPDQQHVKKPLNEVVVGTPVVIRE